MTIHDRETSRGCAECGGPLTFNRKGRIRLTCSPACRQARYRRRRLAAAVARRAG